MHISPQAESHAGPTVLACSSNRINKIQLKTAASVFAYRILDSNKGNNERGKSTNICNGGMKRSRECTLRSSCCKDKHEQTVFIYLYNSTEAAAAAVFYFWVAHDKKGHLGIQTIMVIQTHNFPSPAIILVHVAH